MTAAHSHGIVHRDLKPENIFLARVGQAGGAELEVVKVLDFGISKVTDHPEITAMHALLGSPSYMSPEQLPPPDPRPAFSASAQSRPPRKASTLADMARRDRIEKLQALAGSPNPHEAEAARAEAARLLALEPIPERPEGPDPAYPCQLPGAFRAPSPLEAGR